MLSRMTELKREASDDSNLEDETGARAEVLQLRRAELEPNSGSAEKMIADDDGLVREGSASEEAFRAFPKLRRAQCHGRATLFRNLLVGARVDGEADVVVGEIALCDDRELSR